MSAPRPAARRDVRIWIAFFREPSPTGTTYASRGRGGSIVRSASADMTRRSRTRANPVCASPADLLLRPEVRRIDFEDHPGVVVEPADDAQVERVVRPSDAVVVKESREVPQVSQPLLRGGAEDLRGVVEDGGVAGELDQLPKGRGEVLAAEPAQLRLEHREVPLVQGMEDDALVRRRKGQVRTQDADVPDPRLDLHGPDRERQRLRVRGQRGAADDLRVQLRELAVPALLRLLVPERVPGRVQLEGLRPAPEAGDVEPQNGGRELGPQGEVASALVLERVQLLGDPRARFRREELEALERRRR